MNIKYLSLDCDAQMLIVKKYDQLCVYNQMFA